MDSKEARRRKKSESPVQLSEELKKELGEGADVVLGSKKISQEEKRRQKLREEKKLLKEQRKGKRAAKREALEVSLNSIILMIYRRKNNERFNMIQSWRRSRRNS